MGPHAWLGARLGSVGSKGLVNRSLIGTHTWRGIRLAPSNTSHTDLCCHVPVSFSQHCTLALPSWRCQRARALRGNNIHPTILIPPTSTPLEVWCLGPLGTDSGWALQKPSRQVLQDHPPTPPQPCSPAHEPWGPSASSCSYRCPLPPAELTPALTAPKSWLPNPGGSSQTPDSCPRLLICPPHRPGEPLPTPRPAPSGCPVNRLISHTHLDSCASGPPHPSRPAPKASCCPPGSQGFSWVFLRRLRCDGWVLELSASRQVCSSSWGFLSCLCPSSLWPGSSALALKDTGAFPLLSRCLLRTHSCSTPHPQGPAQCIQAPGGPVPFLPQTRAP